MPGQRIRQTRYQERGTRTILPSDSETVSSSSLTSTPTAAGLLAKVEVIIPNLH